MGSIFQQIQAPVAAVRKEGAIWKQQGRLLWLKRREHLRKPWHHRRNWKNTIPCRIKGAHDDLYVKIEALQDKIRASDTIMNWMRAEQIAIGLIQEANEAISGAAGFDFGQNASTNGGC
ncbi:MAG: hypothetical protein NTV99_11485 [Deltaproteobacteria bacterium]|nr:hypothetical protein [Deltaproteobacteria bacterium]